jgi:transcriptional regulator with XRE-family HTH domain
MGKLEARFPHTVTRGARSEHAPKLNRSALARKIGISRAHMSNILSGKTVPTVLTLRKIARALQVSLDQAYTFVSRVSGKR